MDNKVLIVAAHPDDEVLGCGGTIAKLGKSGYKVHVMILAEGLTSRDERRDCELRHNELSFLSQNAYQANEILGTASLNLFNLPDNRMDSMDLLDIIKIIEKEIQRVQPHTVITHHAGDVNIDHRRIHEAVVTACRPIPGFSVQTLLFFEVASSTEWQISGSAPPFVPNWYVDVSAELTLKIEALKIYQSEMRPWPHARSIRALEHLAHWRGSNVGVDAAEAFILGRNIINKVL